MLVNFSTTVVGFHNYFVHATLYDTELIIVINSSQLVKLLPFLLNMEAKTCITLDHDALSLMIQGWHVQ